MRRRLGIKIFQSEDGSGLIAALVAVSIFTMLVLAIMPFFAQQMAGANAVNAALSASGIRSNFLHNIRNATAWGFTYNDRTCNPSFDCLDTSSGCPSSYLTEPQPINCLYDASNVIVYQPGPNRTYGLSDSGIMCEDFDPDRPNGLCPFRPVITWKCVSMPCTGTTAIHIGVELEFSGNTNIKLNMSRFKIENELR